MYDMKKPLSIKQTRFAHDVVTSIARPEHGKTPPEIYADVYGVQGATAISGASRLMNKDVIQESIRTEIQKVFPPKILHAHLSKLLHARKSAWFEGRRVGSDADNSVRLETLRTILKVIGAYSAEATVIDKRSVNFYIQPDQLGDLKAIASTLDGLNARMLGDG